MSSIWQQIRQIRCVMNKIAGRLLLDMELQITRIKMRHYSSIGKYPLIIDTKKQNFYEMFSILENASIKEIKSSFKKLSKLYHPDIVAGKKEFLALSNEEQQISKDNYIKLIDAYETLIDPKKRLTYDLQLNKYKKSSIVQASNGSGGGSSGLKYTSNGLNFSRNRVHYGKQYVNVENSKFTGKPTGHGKYGVPHFDYDFHLKKNLKMEQRLMDKKYKDAKERFGSRKADDMFSSDRRYHKAFQNRQQQEYDRRQEQRKQEQQQQQSEGSKI